MRRAIWCARIRARGAASLGYKVNVPDFWLAPAPVLPKDAGSIASCGICGIPIPTSSSTPITEFT